MARRPVRKLNKTAVWLLCVGIFGTISFTTIIAVEFFTRWQDEVYYASLLLAPLEPEVPSPTGNSAQTPINSSSSKQPAVAKRPDVNLQAVQKACPGAEAWIRIDGTVIDYPIMLGPDNDYYLTRLPNGKSSKNGSIFMDYRNAADFSGQHTLIYGHNMKSGAMFGGLRNYGKQSFYDNHPTASIFTPNKNYKVLLFAGYRLNPAVEMLPLGFNNTEALNKYVQDVKKRSLFKSDVEVSAGDRLVSLATCEYSIKNGRLVLIGKLVGL